MNDETTPGSETEADPPAAAQADANPVAPQRLVRRPRADSSRADEVADKTIRLPRRRKPQPLMPELELTEIKGTRPGTKSYRMDRNPIFRRTGESSWESSREAERARTALGRFFQRLRAVLIGIPLATTQVVHERLNKRKALAIFSSDALSSSAYATEEILLILILAGTGALYASIPISVVIALLIFVVANSYRQVVKAYPRGGGDYAVASENLGRLPAMVAGAALTIDYVLTVAVSTAAGVAAVVSAVPDLADFRVQLAVSSVVLVTVLNLRGIRESGSVFAIPTYAFMFSFAAMIVVGLIRVALGAGPAEEVDTEAISAEQGLALFLILRAFSAGATALTGIEAIANGVPAFKEPAAKNASTTLAIMAVILACLFVGTTVLAHQFDIVPTEDVTVVAQVGKGAFGDTPFFYILQATTAMILLLAANTSFNAFPRMASILAEDGFMPRQFQFRGDRLGYSNGIIVLGIAAIALLIIFNASVHDLIPLYAVGVFIAFTIGQAGMVIHWTRLRDAGWRGRLAANAVGCAATGVVAVIIGSTKFFDGAWITMLAIGLIIGLFYAINRHYRDFEREMSPPDESSSPAEKMLSTQRVIVPVNKINKAVYWTIEYALSISDNVTAVHVEHEDELTGDRLQEQWGLKMAGIPLVVLESPYRSLLAPFLAYLDNLGTDRPITIAIPQFVTKHWWDNLLHNGTANRLRKALKRRPYTVVVDVPWLIKSKDGRMPESSRDPVVR